MIKEGGSMYDTKRRDWDGCLEASDEMKHWCFKSIVLGLREIECDVLKASEQLQADMLPIQLLLERVDSRDAL